MDTLPDSLIEAARIDGAGHFRIYRDIIMPISIPAIGALAIIVFLGKWNDYLFPIIMIDKPRLMTIMVELPLLNEKGQFRIIPWELVLTGCVVATLPLVIVFFIFQDKIMSSVTLGAVKG
jgi:ABC-type glycerol-3-phosphate transport system permease component